MENYHHYCSSFVCIKSHSLPPLFYLSISSKFCSTSLYSIITSAQRFCFFICTQNNLKGSSFAFIHTSDSLSFTNAKNNFYSLFLKYSLPVIHSYSSHHSGFLGLIKTEGTYMPHPRGYKRHS